jgi:hypothetical protein
LPDFNWDNYANGQSKISSIEVEHTVILLGLRFNYRLPGSSRYSGNCGKLGKHPTEVAANIASRLRARMEPKRHPPDIALDLAARLRYGAALN